MESIQNVMTVIRKNCYMASVDLKDALFSIPVAQEDQKYLKFYIGDKYYNFICMPNGYGPAMSVFTKILKAPFAILRQKGYFSVVYVDDNYLQGDTIDNCLNNIYDTIELLRQLRFTIHIDKPHLIPTQRITFLGFIFDSIHMTIELTKEKKEKISALCEELLNATNISIRQLAKVIGNLVARFPAVPYGKLFYRNLEKDKIISLK